MSQHKLSDEELKQKLVADSIQSDAYKFPTEEIELPSKGHFYDPDGPLASGILEIKYPTAKEEDILTSQNLIKNGTVIDKFMQSIIVSKINYNDLLVGDKNSLMVAGRILAYGSEYHFETKCPECDQKTNQTIQLSDIEDKPIEFDKHTKGTTTFEMELPASKRKIQYQLMTHGLERRVDDMMKIAKKKSKRSGVDPELTTRMKICLLSVDGNDEKSYIDNFVDNEFLSRDSQAFRTEIRSITPDADMSFEFECEHCNYEEVSEFPITAGFFWPKS
tara:strand:- start:678 stop:1505 length:828 start_codon:yes stop_codon:yes gene_type:complete